MTFFQNAMIQAIVLGVVQGVTEFLPVSSSGHLVIVQRLLGVEGPTLTFDVMLHFGTLVAVLIALKDDWMPIVRGVFGREADRAAGWRRLFLLVVGSIPVALVGLLLKDVFESAFSSVLITGVMLLVTGTILWLADLKTRKTEVTRSLEGVGYGDALFIGVAQVFALFPGLSRSGTTMGAGLIRGLNREAAARFAFLLAIPAIAGATLLELPTFFKAPMDDVVPMLVGTAIAAVTGYFAITLFIKMIRRGTLKGFAVYTWILGLVVLLTTRG